MEAEVSMSVGRVSFAETMEPILRDLQAEVGRLKAELLEARQAPRPGVVVDRALAAAYELLALDLQKYSDTQASFNAGKASSHDVLLLWGEVQSTLRLCNRLRRSAPLPELLRMARVELLALAGVEATSASSEQPWSPAREEELTGQLERLQNAGTRFVDKLPALCLVCGDPVSYFGDDVRATCAGCKCPVFHRPTAPASDRVMCMACAMGHASSAGQPFEVVTSPMALREALEYLAAAASHEVRRQRDLGGH